MASVRLCWYLCGLFGIALVLTSFITPGTGFENRLAMVMAMEASASVVCGLLAVAGMHTRAFEARWWAWILVCVAVLATVVLVLMVLG
jgi:hypothetical protein